MQCGSGWFCSFVKWLEKGLISSGLFFYYTSLHLFPYGVFLSFLNLFLGPHLWRHSLSHPIFSPFLDSIYLLRGWFILPLVHYIYLSCLCLIWHRPVTLCLTRNIQKFHPASQRSQNWVVFLTTVLTLEGQIYTLALFLYLLGPFCLSPQRQSLTVQSCAVYSSSSLSGLAAWFKHIWLNKCIYFSCRSHSSLL